MGFSELKILMFAAVMFFMVLVPWASSLNRDAAILLRVKTSQLGHSTGQLNDWVDSAPNAPCNWAGITCDARTHAVVSIDFSNFALSGRFPADFCRISTLRTLNLTNNSFGDFISSDSFSLCSHLEGLDLSLNLFVGDLPEFLTEFTNLTTLVVTGNNFSGEIPASFGRLPKLQTLDLTNNLLNGSIPEFFSNLTELTYLGFAMNPFKPGPLPSSFGRLTKLRQLFAPWSNLAGTIPDTIGNLVSMQNLDLSQNGLTGKIPDSIGGLKSVEQIELYSNQLSGELPDTFWNLSSLARIDVSQNKLTGRIPESLASLRIQSLHLSDNNLEGEIPASLSLNPNLSDLRLFNNSLSGTVPENFGLSSELSIFDVSGNNLEGPFPPNLCAKKTLQSLVIFNNRFSGTVPASYGDCTSLEYVRIHNNKLTGTLPAGFWGSTHYQFIELQNNKFEGQIPPLISNARNISQILISGNKFSGELPSELCRLQTLVILDMSKNQFSGELPSCITELKNLQKLELQENEIGGEIPKSLSSWNALNELNLSFNRLTGEIPSSLGSLKVLNYLDLAGNMLTGEIPTALTQLKLNKFNLSFNRLEGEVPTSFDNNFFYSNLMGNPSLCSSEIQDFPSCRKSKPVSVYLVAILASFAFILVVSLLWLLIKTKRSSSRRKRNGRSWSSTAFQLVRFSESDVLASLSDENIIATGGSGRVFRVQLKTGQLVAVKKLWEANRERESKEVFKSEVETLGRVRHGNIVKLLYSCIGEDFRILVYEYMENGSLGDVLHGEKGGALLDWPKRFNIAVGAAQGLAYLHHDCVPAIVHRDVKSNNILLDGELRPKVADFGLAKILRGDIPKGEQVMSHIAGSYGYIAPGKTYPVFRFPFLCYLRC